VRRPETQRARERGLRDDVIKNLTKRPRGARRLGSAIRNSVLARKLVQAVPADGCVVLRYHSVNDDSGWADDYLQRSLTVPPLIFDAQMRFLKERYDVVAMGELAEIVRSGVRIGGRLAAVTFDDGYEDNYRNALPILASHGLTATFYVTSGTVADASVLWTVRLRFAVRRSRRGAIALPFAGGRRIDISSFGAKESAVRLVTSIVKRSSVREADDILREIETECGELDGGFDRRIMVTESELREMHAAGMQIGAHSIGHYNLPSIDAASLRRELVDSRSFLEATVGAPVLHMAYPDGRTGRHFDGRVALAVADAGYRSAVTSISGPVSRKYSVYSLPRLGVAPRHADLARLAADMQYTRLSRPAEDVFDEVRDAVGLTEGRGERDGDGSPEACPAGRD